MSLKERMKGLSKFTIILIFCITFLLLSIFVPWWIALGEQSAIFTSQMVGGIYAPAWSPFMFTFLGTKLSLHFQKVLALLAGAVVLCFISGYLVRRNPLLSSIALSGSTAFCAAALVFFSVFFPKVGWVGYIFWPFGSSDSTGFFSGMTLNWYVFPGFFLALVALLLLSYGTITLTRPFLRNPTCFAGRSTRKKKGIFGAIFLVCVVAAAAIWGGLSYSPYISAEAFAKDWDFTQLSFEPGDKAVVFGKVTNVSAFNTSYGVYTLLYLDDVGVPMILKGDQTASHSVGKFAFIPVNFRTYWYNGMEFIWADEGFAPLPMLLTFYYVFGSVSYLQGVAFFAEDNNTAGPHFKPFLPFSFPLSEFNMTMVKVPKGLPYLAESGLIGGWSPEHMIDQMNPLRSGTSDNGTLVFKDVNNNNMLDIEDTFLINLPPTVDDVHIETYFMRLHGPTEGTAFIIVRDQGPLFFFVEETMPEESAFMFKLPPDRTNGNLCNSSIEIIAKRGPYSSTSNYEVLVRESDAIFSDHIPAETPGTTFRGSSTIRFEDGGNLGVLDGGDKWILENLANSTEYEFIIKNSGNMVGRVIWVCGVGHNIARYPDVAFSQPVENPINSNNYSLDVASVDWVPAGAIGDYKVQLRKNDSSLFSGYYHPESLSNLPIGPSSDGADTWMTFNDTDGNGYFGPGDKFLVNNTAAQSTYKLKLDYLNYDVTIIEWTT